MLINKKTVSIAAVLLQSATISFAAEATADKAPGYNMALISLVTLVFVLLFVIGMLAYVLKQLNVVVSEKRRKERMSTANVAKVLLLVITLGFSGLRAYAEDKPAAAAEAPAQTNAYIQNIPVTDFYTVVGVISLELLVIFMLLGFIRMFMKALNPVPEHVKDAKAVAKKSWFWDKFNKAATLEQEKDILLDHDYDGIQELDNSLPPWWKYGFYVTIIFACIYLYRFHISHEGKSQYEEYVADMQKGEEEKAAYLAKSANNVDETNVVQLKDATTLADGKEIFEKNCSPCHVADGGGNVGPNLTDDYWLHGGSIKDIFKSIKYGWQDKGMKSWKDDLSPKQIQEVASFIKSLKGSHPASPKAPQGELYIEAPAGSPAADTSAKDKQPGKVAMK